ncbi:high-affinity iron permease [Coemansia sp. RSA 2050]|nr:high-affinity iron permease [Coemansia sp. RSA 2050]KAJ2730959.1 high-affinity iron permease [Coemansia sp. BCRC 34962]
MADVFNVAIFFIILRETIEAGVIISVLLSFSNQMFNADAVMRKKAQKHIWIGAVVGFLICLVIGVTFIAVFYTVADDIWSKAELLWEGIFSLIAAVMITAMGLGMLRSGRMQDKWRAKLGSAMVEESGRREGWRRWVDFKVFSKRYLFFHLPFLTVLREGLEAVVFVGGVSLGATAKSIPLAVVIGLLCGGVVGYAIYRTGSAMRFHWFFVASTCLLYLIAAGLVSKSVGYFEEHRFAKYAGADPDASGVIDVRVNVWALDYGSPEAKGGSGWGIFNAILGWTNVATYGTVISYSLYWGVLAAYLVVLGVHERRGDRRRQQQAAVAAADGEDSGGKLQPRIVELAG